MKMIRIAKEEKKPKDSKDSIEKGKSILELEEEAVMNELSAEASAEIKGLKVSKS